MNLYIQNFVNTFEYSIHPPLSTSKIASPLSPALLCALNVAQPTKCCTIIFHSHRKTMQLFSILLGLIVPFAKLETFSNFSLTIEFKVNI